MKYDEDGVPIMDEPLFSPIRILRAIRLYFYLTIQCELDGLKFIPFLISSRRPYAAHKKKLY